jgi:hypothetical protein
MKAEISDEKHIFFNKFKNVQFINYIVDKIEIKPKKNKIIVSP